MDNQNQSISNSGLHVVCASVAHLDAIVQIHMAAFEGFFLESLGACFLNELYRGFITDPSGVCLVAVEGNNVVGFVAGTTQPDGFFRRLLLKRWYAFVFAGVNSMALHPIRVGKKFLLALRYRGERPVDLSNSTLLSSIGVTPIGIGKGIGRILISTFCEMARATGASSVFLTTDSDNNDTVNRFYLSNGFTLHSSFVKERNRRMNLYVICFSDVQPTNQK